MVGVMLNSRVYWTGTLLLGYVAPDVNPGICARMALSVSDCQAMMKGFEQAGFICALSPTTVGTRCVSSSGTLKTDRVGTGYGLSTSLTGRRSDGASCRRVPMLPAAIPAVTIVSSGRRGSEGDGV